MGPFGTRLLFIRFLSRTHGRVSVAETVEQFTVRTREREAFENRLREPASAGKPPGVAPVDPKLKRLQRDPLLHDGMSHDGQRCDCFSAQTEFLAKDLERIGVDKWHVGARKLPEVRVHDTGSTPTDEELITMLEDEGDGVSLDGWGARGDTGQLVNTSSP